MKRNMRDAMQKLAAAESAFVGSEFLAPVVRGRGVTVRIAGVRCTLEVRPGDFEGWGVFQARSHTEAMLLRPASAAQRQRYLRLFPPVRLIVCDSTGRTPMAVPAELSDTRIQLGGPAAVELCAGADVFDAIAARFDGSRFWFDQSDPRADPAAAAYLRRALSGMTDPHGLDRPGLTKGQRIAYAIQFTRRTEAIAAERHRQADIRLTAALKHAGAELRDFADGGDEWRVSYLVDGRRHTSMIRKDDLTVRSAGICLSGRDADFDLASLVGVLREGM
ncbi:MAG TPA: hypothetical protein VHY37_08210 [Tepidisphaeraceae bacterium]|nr:hypothetical protein [Tepidisphaeraceae bacterium]